MLKRLTLTAALVLVALTGACQEKTPTTALPETDSAVTRNDQVDPVEVRMLEYLIELRDNPEYTALAPGEKKYVFAVLAMLREVEPELVKEYADFYTPAKVAARGRDYCLAESGAFEVEPALVATELNIMQITRQRCHLLEAKDEKL